MSLTFSPFAPAHNKMLPVKFPSSLEYRAVVALGLLTEEIGKPTQFF
jgi:hypothetical protein